MTFNGKKIHLLRWEQKLSTRALAKLMDGVVSNVTILNWERGKTYPDAAVLIKLASALKVELGYFFE